MPATDVGALDELGACPARLNGTVVSLTHQKRVGGFYTLDLIGDDGLSFTGIGDTPSAALANAEGKAQIIRGALAVFAKREAVHA